MRQQIQEGFRKAGKSLQNFDDAYSDKVFSFLQGDPAKSNFTRDMVANTLSHPLTPPRLEIEPGDPRSAILMGRAYQVAAPVIGGAVRYGLPAAGVTAAGIGLMDIANGLNQQTASTIMPQEY